MHIEISEMLSPSDGDDVAAGDTVVERSLSELDARIAALEKELEDSSDGERDDGASAPAPSRKKRPADPRWPARPVCSEWPAASATAGRSESGGSGLRCEACGITVTSEALMREHVQGRKHHQAVRMFEARAEGRYCEVCRPRVRARPSLATAWTPRSHMACLTSSVCRSAT